MVEYTQGEWKAEHRSTLPNGIKFFWVVNDKVSVGSRNPEDAEIMAAAPEMLTALEAVSVLRGTLEMHGLLEQVDRAIAKARGEA